MTSESPSAVLKRDPNEVSAILDGFPQALIDSGTRLTELGSKRADFNRALTLLLLCHQPDRDLKGTNFEPLPGQEDRLREDLGLDSLALAEAAFLCEEVFGTQLDTREIALADTLGQLSDMVWATISAEPSTDGGAG